MAEKSIENYSLYIKDIFNSVADGLQIDWNGDKFPGSFGVTKLFSFVDYWTLRQRSRQLFTENLYCKGIIRRILRNEIFTGLVPDAAPFATVTPANLPQDEREKIAVQYGEQMTELFNLYGSNYNIFDYRKELTFGEFQEQCRREAIICGDGIIVSRINQATGLPHWDWINGNYIRSPAGFKPRAGNYIKDGVELDPRGRHVAYHVQRIINGKTVSERVPVYGEKSGRQISWMVYGSERMIDEVRGEPLLSCMLYMLKELDRYRDAEARAAVINSLIAFIVERPSTADISSDPLAGLARLNTESGAQSNLADNEPAPKPEVSFENPGTAITSATAGEKITSYSTQRPNVNYKAFEDAILNAICWALEVPPEIVKLEFKGSYSASRQADNEFQVYLKYRNFKNAKDFCQIIYEEFIIQAVLNGLLDLPGFIQAVFVSQKWHERAAWLNCAWSGVSRPNVDRNKDVKASAQALRNHLTTYDIECRRISGLSFRQVLQRYVRERNYAEQLNVNLENVANIAAGTAQEIETETQTELASEMIADSVIERLEAAHG
ncbi:MAG: phage portal protein [Treponema sp.]|nr:phage portal protein [Treponema sp.]